MKRPIAALALVGALAGSSAWAQVPSQVSVPGSAQPASGASGAPGGAPPPDARGAQRSTTAPPLTPPDQLKPPTIDLPNEPIEPYLLRKDVGPFMVMARVFRGVDAERMALALVKELRNDYQLPAYILRTKDFPGRSNIRGVPPTVPSEVMQPNVRMPEKVRTLDEAAVLVGNEKTLADQEKLWRQVKKLKPKCLDGMSSPFPWRQGLSHALRTTNPYVPAQLLYPHPRDRLVVQINAGLRSIINCPGRFSLQVAEFSGRSAYQFNPNQPIAQVLPSLSTSPLQTAHDDAERLADKLARAPEIQAMHLPVYVYHDRTSSRVFVGSWNSPNEPAAFRMREELLRMATSLVDKTKRKKDALDTMIVPALALTDLNEYKAKLKQ
jgi:hypothetical protein